MFNSCKKWENVALTGNISSVTSNYVSSLFCTCTFFYNCFFFLLQHTIPFTSRAKQHLGTEFFEDLIDFIWTLNSVCQKYYSKLASVFTLKKESYPSVPFKWIWSHTHWLGYKYEKIVWSKFRLNTTIERATCPR